MRTGGSANPGRGPAPARAWGAAILLLSLLLAGWASFLAAQEQKVVVVLKDGQRIEGIDVQRQGDVVEIQLKTGDMMTIPASLVQQIEVVAAPPPPISGPPLPPSEGEDAQPKNLSGPPLPEPKEKDGKPRTLSGPGVTASPSAQQQLAVFGPPPPPQQPIIDPTWQPTSGIPEWTKPEMKPTEWSEPIVDPTWTPTSAYDPNADVLAAGRHEWSKPAIDPTWQPTDAFAK